MDTAAVSYISLCKESIYSLWMNLSCLEIFKIDFKLISEFFYTDRQTDKTDHLTPCTYTVGGNKSQLYKEQTEQLLV